jgi:hypothetical protein
MSLNANRVPAENESRYRRYHTFSPARIARHESALVFGYRSLSLVIYYKDLCTERERERERERDTDREHMH